MSDGKTILVDVSRCTGCRGCQVACKQWNELPATDTVQTGSYQNPPDMNGDTYKIVRFREGRHENGKPYWNFFTDMCRHCVNPPCVLAADEGTMIHDEATGAVVYTEKTAENDFDVLLDACPYRIPRKNEKTGAIVKCTMCIDRISAGGIPACVQSCPTGAMRFGERAAMLELAHKRVEELKKEFPKVHAVDPDGTFPHGCRTAMYEGMEKGTAGAWGRGEVRGYSRILEEASPFPRTSAQKSLALI